MQFADYGQPVGILAQVRDLTAERQGDGATDAATGAGDEDGFTHGADSCR